MIDSELTVVYMEWILSLPYLKNEFKITIHDDDVP